MPRQLYADNMNSVIHLGLGLYAGYSLNSYLIMGYLAYQIYTGGNNTQVDITEFLLPMVFIGVIKKYVAL